MNVIKVTYEVEIPNNFTGQIEFENGDVWILENGKFHKEDGPAFFSKYGDEHWYKKGIRHRIDGPAIEWNYGFKHWYIEGRQHFPSEIVDCFKQFLFLKKKKKNTDYFG